MRISIVRGDPGFDPTHSRRVRRVTVDGTPFAAVTADEEAGYADVVVLGDDGRVQLDPFTGAALTRRVAGRVAVELEPRGERDWDESRRGEARVRVGRDGNGDILVQVYSVARPGAIKQMRLERSGLPSGDAATAQKAGACAGAAAELLCDQFRDRICPDSAARAAVEQCMAMLADEGRAGG